MSSLTNKRAIVVGASRGLGQGMAVALARAGAHVTAIGRNAEALAETKRLGGDAIAVEQGDATDAELASQIVADGKPDIVVMVAGARPALQPLSKYGWEALSEPWNTDVKAAFSWLHASLNQPLAPGARVVVISSGAALFGSPLSGGYAGAKQTQRFLCKYAALEAKERELEITFQCVLPQLNPNTGLGQAAIEAYAARAGVDPETFVRDRFGDTPLSPEIAGNAIVELLTSPEREAQPELLLAGKGLRPLEGK